MHPLNRILLNLGLHVQYVPRHPPPRRSEYVAILDHFGIDHVLDVGAFEGHSASDLFACGFHGSVISFEPVDAHFEKLAEAAESGRNRGWDWTAEKVALADQCVDALIHVAGNGRSSSLAPMLEEHVRLNPESAYRADQAVSVITLDAIAGRVVPSKRRTLLQLDVQGFERKVLAGARDTLQRLAGVQLEVSLRPVYEGGLSVTEAFDLMERAGFVPVYVQPAWKDPVSCIFYQIDVLWITKTICSAGRSES